MNSYGRIIETVDQFLACSPAEIPPPRRFLQLHQYAQEALWAAQLLSRYKIDPTRDAAILRNLAPFTLADVAQRLRACCYTNIPELSVADASGHYGPIALDPMLILDRIGVIGVLAAHDPAFPWGALHLGLWSLISSKVTDEIIKRYEFSWQERETLRVAYIYAPIPWTLPAVAAYSEHFVHRSLQNKALLAYTIDADKGGRDIQTQIKPGRYLKKFYSKHYSSEQIRAMAAEITAEGVELRIARSTKEIVRIYNGQVTTSCMTGQASACVYGESDLGVAYILDSRGEVRARAVVWPDKKVFYRIYGDIQLLQAKLAAHGYHQGSAWCFEGAKIRRVRLPGYSNPNYVHMASIDGHGAYNTIPGDPDHLVIAKNGRCSGNHAAN